MIRKSIKHKITNKGGSKLSKRNSFFKQFRKRPSALQRTPYSKKMSMFNKQKEGAMPSLVDHARNLTERIMKVVAGYLVGEMVGWVCGYVEQKWFMGDRNKMVASMAGVIFLGLGIFLGLVFYKDG
jgi:hypothetical protein